MLKKIIEIWADSFHEGNWCCENIAICAKKYGLSIDQTLINGFQPIFTLKSGDYEVDLIIYGSYRSWSPLPQKINDLIEWGKPDFIAYDPDNDLIHFAVEETAATPTGNQATQRCERQYGSARFRIPYWYLVSEYGMHRDGGMRRDSIWPTIAALKLTVNLKTPCIVLHYSDIDNPEDYSKGKGLNLVFESLFRVIDNVGSQQLPLNEIKEYLDDQYEDMLLFTISQWQNVIDFLPSEKLINDGHKTSRSIAEFAVDDPNSDPKQIEGLLVWPTIPDLPKVIRQKQIAKPLIKHDDLCLLFEKSLSDGLAYALSSNAGSGKPPTADKVELWISQQEVLFSRSPALDPPAVFNLKLPDFPDTGSGENRRHLTTAKNIVYLFDSWFSLRKLIYQAYPRLSGLLDSYKSDIPVFVYVSNSLKPGRLFGDPYTGQLSAYSTAFGKFDTKKRMVIAYFPHQAHTQAILNGEMGANKGITLMKELTDLLIFTSGVAVSLSDGRIY